MVAGSTLVVAGSGEQRVDSASKCDGGADLARDGLGGPVDGLGGPIHGFSFFYFSYSINGGGQSNRLCNSLINCGLPLEAVAFARFRK